MSLSHEKIQEFNELAKPLMLWLEQNMHPHSSVRIDSHYAELCEGLTAINREKLHGKFANHG